MEYGNGGKPRDWLVFTRSKRLCSIIMARQLSMWRMAQGA